jgi:hypothetical protein
MTALGSELARWASNTDGNSSTLVQQSCLVDIIRLLHSTYNMGKDLVPIWSGKSVHEHSDRIYDMTL